ncbi:peptidyl-dipeptidase Dcp [Sphingomonas sp. MMSM20]|uniref:peptidyl-dipeptidase Dcp n=1 Tax=Sphingomonas lycopersici TaxID=2951807 RepID=UPI0022384C21|nr:peptidyl-dipeptidase Dcp [Sphingomonas lycopersici]MCW6532629.1 peptidyl-dipeptidase Dcp [Sphingomonas lycopersici]
MAYRFSIATLLLAGATCLAAPASAGQAGAPRANPFTAPSTLPFQAPRFDLITDADYQPAFETAMQQHLAEVARIADNPAPPTFDNTITALEKSGRMLERVSLAFFGVVQANTNDTLDKVQEAVAPKLSQHQDAINLNPKLFARVKTLWEKRAALKLDAEQAQVLKIYYDGFVHAGAQLSAADQTRLKALNTQLASLETSFQQKLLAAAKAGALVVDDKAKLAGLDDGKIAAAAAAAKDRKLDGKWVIPLQNTTQQPDLEDMTDRATREALFNNGWTRAEKGDANDTRPAIQQIAQLRAEKAKLLGYPNWAAYTLYDQMARTPETASSFMRQLAAATAPAQKRDAAELQAQIDSTGGKFQLKPWDWDHYAAQVRKAKYDLDQSEVKPYFELKTVLEQGVFYAANQLYGISFKPRTDIPVYQPDVTVYTVYDKDGAELGLMYFDYFKRDNKNGGAWMSNFVNQSKLLGTKPVVYNVANFTKPAAGQPALISSDDVTTMFHEFGHALHGLFASQTYPTVSGTNVARDFVEFPSQFNEHWAWDPKVLAHYAKDYRTGAPMPAALVDKIKKAAKFNQGYALGEVIAAAMLDMDWHSLPADAPKQDVDQFEAKALAATGLDVTDVPPRYRSSYFLHIWANGYSAGYYAYLWTQMLEHDAYHWFVDHGGLTRENGQRFRDMILSKGHTEDYAPMFKAFYGKDPDVGPMLEEHGLTPPAK